MEVSFEEVARILQIVDDSHYVELSLEIGDVRLKVRKQGAGAAVAASSPDDRAPGVDAPPPPTPVLPASTHTQAPTAAAATPAADEPIPEGLVAVRAPMLGTFYRASAPGLPPFATEGQQVGPRDTIGLIEVMKLFTTVAAGVSGRVVRFLADNGALVEFDEPLVVIEPMEGAS